MGVWVPRSIVLFSSGWYGRYLCYRADFLTGLGFACACYDWCLHLQGLLMLLERAVHEEALLPIGG